MQLELFLG
jgi:hypothetical protein